MPKGIAFSLPAVDRQRLSDIVAAPLSPQKHGWRGLIAAGHRRSGDVSDQGRNGQVEDLCLALGVSCTRASTACFAVSPVRKGACLPDRVSRIVRLTKEPPSHKAPYSERRAMAKAAGLAVSTVQSIWKRLCLAPHRWRSFHSPDAFCVRQMPDFLDGMPRVNMVF